MSSSDANRNYRDRECQLCGRIQLIVTGRPRKQLEIFTPPKFAVRVLMVQLRIYGTDVGLAYGPRILICEKCVQTAMQHGQRDAQKQLGVSLLRLMKNVYQSFLAKV
jgi:hypothetical protein